MRIIAAADGSALGNPGPAGWAWYVDDDHWAAGGWPHGTNNQGELMAVLDLFLSTAHLDADLLVLCDSQYVINAVTKWMPGWKRKGWRKADGKPVLNRELLQQLDNALAGRRYTFQWVKGHAGHDLNEAADERARAVAAAYQAGRPIPGGPGWPGSTRDRVHAASDSAPSISAESLQLELFADLDGPELRSESPADTVIRLERRLLEPAVRADQGELALLLHPAFHEIGSSGVLWSRDETVQELAGSAPARMDVISVDEIDPGTVLLVYRSEDAAGRGTLRSSLWRNDDGVWQVRFHQGTAEA